MEKYTTLHYALDFKYDDQTSFTGVFVTNYATRFINEK